jgi:hypothetical protein
LNKTEPIPRLIQDFLYGFASLIMGLGAKADTLVKESFGRFKDNFGSILNLEQFRTQGYSTVISALMRSSPLTPTKIKAAVGNISEAVIWGVDLGIREVFVTSDGTSKSSHRIRRTSTAEYYHLAGFKRDVVARAKYNKDHPHDRQILAQSPSLKVNSTTAFIETVKYLLTNFKTITSYYDNGLWHNKAKFNKYISKQRATA